MRNNTGKNISENSRDKDSQKLPYHAKKSATDAFKTSPKRVTQKTAETTGDWLLIELRKFQKIHNKIMQKRSHMRMIYKDIYL